MRVAAPLLDEFMWCSTAIDVDTAGDDATKAPAAA